MVILLDALYIVSTDSLGNFLKASELKLFFSVKVKYKWMLKRQITDQYNIKGDIK